MNLEEIQMDVGKKVMNVWLDTAHRKHVREERNPKDYVKDVINYVHVRYEQYKQIKYDHGRRE